MKSGDVLVDHNLRNSLPDRTTKSSADNALWEKLFCSVICWMLVPIIILRTPCRSKSVNCSSTFDSSHMCVRTNMKGFWFQYPLQLGEEIKHRFIDFSWIPCSILGSGFLMFIVDRVEPVWEFYVMNEWFLCFWSELVLDMKYCLRWRSGSVAETNIRAYTSIRGAHAHIWACTPIPAQKPIPNSRFFSSFFC